MDKDLTKSINYRNALKYLEEKDYLVDFMVRKFYGCGTEPKRVSDKFRCAMRENYLRMRADDLLLGRVDFLHCIREYILEDDGEYGKENFREWLSEGK